MTIPDAYAAGFRAGIEAAAKACEESWQSGYRGEVNVGFAHVVRALAIVEAGDVPDA